MITIFLNASDEIGFRKGSIHSPNSNDDDQPGGATPMALAAPALDNPPNALSAQPHRPWLAWLVPRDRVGTLPSDAVPPSRFARIASQKGRARRRI
jgi:hypothetical protein